MHIAYKLFGVKGFALRLPVFIPGILLIMLSYKFALAISRDRSVANLTAFFVAFSQYLTFYSTIGRGYIIQAVLAVIIGLAVLNPSRKISSKNQIVIVSFCSFLILYTESL